MSEPPRTEAAPPLREGTVQPLEGLKAELEVVKHITTLNAGSIVVIGTFLKDIFPSEDAVVAMGTGLKLLIAAAFLLFGLSLALSAGGMYALSGRISESRAFNKFWARLVLWPPLVFFVLALVCFGIAVLIDLF
jgi:hypothetical protein